MNCNNDVKVTSMYKDAKDNLGIYSIYSYIYNNNEELRTELRKKQKYGSINDNEKELLSVLTKKKFTL